jgi:hypothetical protein
VSRHNLGITLQSAKLGDKFCSYIEDRRREPRDDVLTALATANYPTSQHIQHHPRQIADRRDRLADQIPVPPPIHPYVSHTRVSES